MTTPHTTDDDPTACPDWCPGCVTLQQPDPGESTRSHLGVLHVTRDARGLPIVAVTLGRTDDANTGEPGSTSAALRTAEDMPGRTITAEQARALADALDYAARQLTTANNAQCSTCGRPWPLDGLDGGRCALCVASAGRLRIVGTEPEALTTYEPPSDETPARIARTTTRARYGDRATCVEVTHHDGTDWTEATDLVRVRLGGDGYMTANGARKLAAYLLDAATQLDHGETASGCP